jgi:integrase/recombinase XerD
LHSGLVLWGRKTMGKRRIATDWTLRNSIDLNANLRRYQRFLENGGFRQSTIDSYVGNVGRYLEFAGTDRPRTETATKFRDALLGRNLSRSTLNNYVFTITKYHEMLGEKVKLPLMKPNSALPYYFNQDDVVRILSSCQNLKHLAMLQTLFYGALRASELCNLDDRDLDLKALTLHVREGKGGRDGIVYIAGECARTLKEYLEVRPPLEIDGKMPLYYTDFGNRWDRRDVCRMFHCYKKKAGVEKAGGVHVFAVTQ